QREEEQKQGQPKGSPAVATATAHIAPGQQPCEPRQREYEENENWRREDPEGKGGWLAGVRPWTENTEGDRASPERGGFHPQVLSSFRRASPNCLGIEDKGRRHL